MSLGQFISKQFIRVIQWNESGDGALSYRYPMADMEIENGGQLTVRESQLALFVNEGRIADVFGPGLHTLNTQNMPVLTDLMNWSKDFESPFKSDVYFFSTRLQIDQKWGTPTPITIRDKDYGVVETAGVWKLRVSSRGPEKVLYRSDGHEGRGCCRGPGRPANHDDCGADDRDFRKQRDFFCGHGSESGRAG